MSTNLTEPTSEISPLVKARMGGACWLMTIVTATNLLAVKGVNVQRWKEQARKAAFVNQSATPAG